MSSSLLTLEDTHLQDNFSIEVLSGQLKPF
jgi:hypothetical protein